MDGILTGITILSQSGPGSNGNEGVTPHSQEIQKWNLTTGCSFVAYSEYQKLGVIAMKEWLYTSQRLRNGASPPDTVWCQIWDTQNLGVAPYTQLFPDSSKI